MAASAADTGILRQLWHPRSVMARFFAKRILKSAGIWGLVFGLYGYASAVGFLHVAPTAAERAKVVSSFADNAGLKAIFGDPYQLNTVGGFVDWRATGVIGIVGAVWGLLIATKVFRGEETAGRWELFLAGQTTARRAALNALAGLGAGLVLMYVLTAVITIVAGHAPDVHIGLGQSLLFACTAVAAAAEFLAIGALASQLMPIRARAAGLAAGTFGVFFILRAMASAAPSAHWLLYCSPLGWIQLVRPLTDMQAIWLLPIAGLIVALCAATVFLAGRRDLGAAIVADKDIAKAHTAYLNGPLLAALRLRRTSILVWLLATGGAALLYGSLTKTAAQVFASSDFIQRFGGQVFREQAALVGAKTYAGLIFLLMMTLIMALVAGAVGAMREDEAQGYLENFFVRLVGRLQWLWGRIAIIAAVAVLAGLTAGLGMWLGAANQHIGISSRELLLAGLNATAPALLLLGVGIFTLGFVPRLTTAVAYGIIAWSFLMQMIGSIANFSHWILDTSVLQHIALAPTTDPNWRIVGTYIGAGLVLASLGAWRFQRRDLANE